MNRNRAELLENAFTAKNTLFIINKTKNKKQIV